MQNIYTNLLASRSVFYTFWLACLVLTSCQPEGFINKIKYDGTKIINTCETFTNEVQTLAKNNNVSTKMMISKFDNSDYKFYLEPGQFEVKKDTLFFRLIKDLNYAKLIDPKATTTIVVNVGYTAIERVRTYESKKEGIVGQIIIDAAYIAKNSKPFYYKIPLKNAEIDGKQIYVTFGIQRIDPKGKKPLTYLCNTQTTPIGKTQVSCCGPTIWDSVRLQSLSTFPAITSTSETYLRYKSFSSKIDVTFTDKDFSIPDSLMIGIMQQYIDKYANLGFVLKRVNIKGFASPNGADTMNLRISSKRAEIVKKGLEATNKENKNLVVQAQGMGEDWDRVREILLTSDFKPEQRAQMNSLINNISTLDERERLFKGLPYYEKIKNEVFSLCRHTFATLDFEYVGEKPTLDEYKEVLPLISVELEKVAQETFTVNPYKSQSNTKEELEKINYLLTRKATANLYAMRAGYALGKKEWVNVIEDMKKCQQLDNNNPVYGQVIRGIEFRTVDSLDFDGLVNWLEKYNEYASVYSEDRQVFMDRAIIMEKIGWIAGAREEYQKMWTPYMNQNALALNNRGVANMRTYRFTEAQNDFLEALHINEKMPATYFNLAVLYAIRGYTRRTIEALERAIELDPKYKAYIFENPVFDTMSHDPKFDRFR